MQNPNAQPIVTDNQWTIPENKKGKLFPASYKYNACFMFCAQYFACFNFFFFAICSNGRLYWIELIPKGRICQKSIYKAFALNRTIHSCYNLYPAPVESLFWQRVLSDCKMLFWWCRRNSVCAYTRTSNIADIILTSECNPGSHWVSFRVVRSGLRRIRVCCLWYNDADFCCWKFIFTLKIVVLIIFNNTPYF